MHQMYNNKWDKQYRENPKMKMATFSSTLLDEIYRSIDGKSEDLKPYKEKPAKIQGLGRLKTKPKSENEDKEIESFRRNCLVDKLNAIDDVMFFSSSSSSSDSSGTLSSSSESEFFGNSSSKSRVSCFSSTRSKPRTKNPLINDQNEFALLDDDNNHNVIKSKSTALKMYANLKKVKQPISPGGRLTNFINSLFTNANSKKAKNADKNGVSRQDSSTCSSASSFSRSCLSKYSPKSREKMRNGIKRTVRFDPVSVIVDEDCRPCGHKSLYDEVSDKFKGPTFADVKIRLTKRIGSEEEGEDDDAASDASSDLFELDHLALFGDDRFCDELPVYETTNVHTNRAIASGLIS